MRKYENRRKSPAHPFTTQRGNRLRLNTVKLTVQSTQKPVAPSPSIFTGSLRQPAASTSATGYNSGNGPRSRPLPAFSLA